MSGALGSVTWFVGRPGSGKSTLATRVVDAFRHRERPVLWLDSDDLRPFLTPHPTYDEDERDAFYRALAHIALRAYEGGVHVVISATAPKRAYRDALRAKVPNFVEVYLDCGLDVVRQRDPKGLYRKADDGQIQNLPGYGGVFEPSDAPELQIDTREDLERCIAIVVRRLGLDDSGEWA